jgi:putative membrane protein
MDTYAGWMAAAFHYVALALGFTGVFIRGQAMRSLVRNRKDDAALQRLFLGDNLWGVAALLWLATGLLRAFAGLAKGTDYYLVSPLFWVKMGLFVLVIGLELFPMITLIRWRLALSAGKPLVHQDQLPLFVKLNHLEAVLVVIMVFVASGMARGFGL